METLQKAKDGKRWLERELGRKIPKPTLRRWRQKAGVELEEIDGEYWYKVEDLVLIKSMVTTFNDMPVKLNPELRNFDTALNLIHL